MVQPLQSGRLACGCEVGFSRGVEGSPVTVTVTRKADGCPIALHVSRMAIYDHREALRPSTRIVPRIQPDFEEEG